MISAKTSTQIGAKINRREFDLIGIINFLAASLRPSARGCRRPQNPTTFGPTRR